MLKFNWVFLLCFKNKPGRLITDFVKCVGCGGGGTHKIKQLVYEGNRFQSCVKILIISK